MIFALDDKTLVLGGCPLSQVADDDLNANNFYARTDCDHQYQRQTGNRPHRRQAVFRFQSMHLLTAKVPLSMSGWRGLPVFP